MYVCVNTDSPNEDNDGDGDDDGGNTGAIIGGIVGGVGGLIFISTSTTIIILCWKNNRSQNDNVGKNY